MKKSKNIKITAFLLIMMTCATIRADVLKTEETPAATVVVSNNDNNTGVTCREWLTKASNTYIHFNYIDNNGSNARIKFDYINRHKNVPIEEQDEFLRRLGRPTDLTDLEKIGIIVLSYRCTDAVIGVGINSAMWYSLKKVRIEHIIVRYYGT